VPVAKRILAEFEGAFGELAQFVEVRSGRITVAALPSIAAAILPATIKRFQSSHAQVDVAIRDVLSGVIMTEVHPPLARWHDARAMRRRILSCSCLA
jgi:LysR family carnitine catabolism transcriptional activator